MSLADLRPGLRAFLLADAAILALVGSRAFDGQMPQGEKRTSIVFTQISGVGDHHMQGASGLSQTRYQIDAWSPDVDVAASLARSIKARIDGYRGAFSWGSNSPPESVAVQGVFFASARDTWAAATKLFGKSQDFIIWFEER